MFFKGLGFRVQGFRVFELLRGGRGEGRRSGSTTAVVLTAG